MTSRILAQPNHNLFCYPDKYGRIVPITYRDLMTNLRSWLQKVGVQDTSTYSSHSLRRGGTSHAFKSKIGVEHIKRMGGWKSDCYRRYIDVDMNTQIKTWLQFIKQ